MSNSSNNKRIVKNTLSLYVRMLFLMIIGLYTSRVILQALGIEDFGVYNVVGGFVALFSVLSRSLSTAASRFLNYEMGRGNKELLGNVFSTNFLIHVTLAVIIVIFAEIIGYWFINNRMVIPPERLSAANWVFQFSILTFCFNLLAVPYYATIIAHERMSVFAYISIFEGLTKLLICYLVMISSIDRLIMYAGLMFLVQVGVSIIYICYCKYNFSECTLRWIFYKPLLKEIFYFASWNMIGASSVILRNHGGNVLINLFGGPVVNAARAVANQVLHAVNGFAEGFMTALKPQITQSYASGNTQYMMTLIFQGSRFSYYILLIPCLPILINTDYILSLWLKTVPEHSVLFVQLTLIFTMLESISSPLITAQLATGKVKKYQLLVGGIQLMNVPVSYVLLRLGGIPETILFVAIFFSLCCLMARLYMLRTNINLKVDNFITRVFLNIILVTLTATILPCLLRSTMQMTFLTFVLITAACLLSSISSILYVGCNKEERNFVFSKISRVIKGLIPRTNEM